MSASEGLHYDGIQQGHVLGTSYWQLVCSVVVDDLGDGEERRTVLPKNVTPVCKLAELHVHEAFTAPNKNKRQLIVKNLLNCIKKHCRYASCKTHSVLQRVHDK